MKNLINKSKKDKIDAICSKYDIRNYSINSDGSIDVDGNVHLERQNLTSIPLKFNDVYGGFFCTNNNLTNISGSPKMVNGDFYCYTNKITSLIGGPKHVGGSLSIDSNQITNLIGAPEYIGGNFYIFGNASLTSTYSGEIDIELVGNVVGILRSGLPEIIKGVIETDNHKFKLILKYQRYFQIWNDDLSLNLENFKDLILEIEEGLE